MSTCLGYYGAGCHSHSTRHPNLSQGQQDRDTLLVQTRGLQAEITVRISPDLPPAQDLPVENVWNAEYDETHEDVNNIIQRQDQHQTMKVFLFRIKYTNEGNVAKYPQQSNQDLPINKSGN